MRLCPGSASQAGSWRRSGPKSPRKVPVGSYAAGGPPGKAQQRTPLLARKSPGEEAPRLTVIITEGTQVCRPVFPVRIGAPRGGVRLHFWGNCPSHSQVKRWSKGSPGSLLPRRGGGGLWYGAQGLWSHEHGQGCPEPMRKWEPWAQAPGHSAEIEHDLQLQNSLSMQRNRLLCHG